MVFYNKKNIMNRFKVKIVFLDGNEVHAKVEARNKKDAIRRVRATEQFQDFQSASIKEILVEKIEIQSIDNTRFAVTNIDNKQGWYVVADLDNRIKVEFKKGHYNDIQKVCFFDNYEDLSPAELATALREIGDFIRTNFKEIICYDI